MVKQTPPASVLASWPKPNFVDPVTRGPALQVICTLLVILVIVVLSLRTWVRGKMKHMMGADDWLILAALLPALVLYGACMASVDYGWDRHQWDQQPQWFQTSELISWLIQLMYTMTMAFAKASILVSFLRLIPSGPARWASWGTLVVVTIWGISLSLATIFSCNPVYAYWEDSNDDRCTDESIRLLVTSVINILTDIIVIVIPMSAFWHLQVPTRQKVILFALLNFGLIATVASIARTVVLAQAEVEWDITWNGYVIWILTMIECSLALICASVPSLRPLFHRFVSYRSSRSTAQDSSQVNKISSRLGVQRNDGHFNRMRECQTADSDEIPLERITGFSKDESERPTTSSRSDNGMEV